MITTELFFGGNFAAQATLSGHPAIRRPTMRKSLVVPSVASLALALAASAASAQTVISRSVAAEPVETIVSQTPAGTIVTRRPVDTGVVQPTYARPIYGQPVVQAPAVVQPMAPRSAVVEEDTIDAITTREVVRRAEAAPSRQLITRDVAARPAVRTQRHVVRKATTTRTTRVVPRLVLAPRERQIIYRTIVEREVVPRQQMIVAPSALPGPTYAQPLAVQARPPIVAADEVVVQPAAPITVGAVLPESVPLYAIPQNVALTVPATRPYSYAYLGGRAYLVDPATGTVVADVTD